MHYQFDGNPPTMVFHIHKVSKKFVNMTDVDEEIELKNSLQCEMMKLISKAFLL